MQMVQNFWMMQLTLDERKLLNTHNTRHEYSVEGRIALLLLFFVVICVATSGANDVLK